jgi:hypothetical protein
MMPFANTAFGFWIETVAFYRKDSRIEPGYSCVSFKIASPLRANPCNLSLWVDFRDLGVVFLNSVLIFIPLFMSRPALAAQADRPAPLVAAAGAEPARAKSIPGRAAAVEEVFRVIAVAAIPAARSVRTPFAERATNAVELLIFVARRSFLGSLGWRQSVLEEPEC